MARKTFISYKYSEAQNLRNDIIEALGGPYWHPLQLENSFGMVEGEHQNSSDDEDF